MTKRKTFLLILSLFFFLTTASFAQILNPVKWDFRVRPKSSSEIELIFTARIDPKWHLYSQDIPAGGPIPTSFSFSKSDDFERIGGVEEISVPELKFDQSFNMELKMFSLQAVFRQVIRPLTISDFVVNGFVEFMSCDDERCLPPREEGFSLPVKTDAPSPESKQPAREITTVDNREETAVSVPVLEETDLETVAEESGDGTAPPVMSASEKDAAAAAGMSDLSGKSLWGLFFLSFVLGLAGILTPCVYPMIPMTVSFFIRGSDKRTKAIMQALIFGLSIVAIYTSIGMIISLTSAGANFASVLSTHWIPNLIFFALFLLFAASFFGMFEIVLPAGLSNRADRQADKGGYLGAFFMALTLVLVSFSCTGPIVGYLLVQAATGEVLEPLVGMFGFSLAFALPFTLLAFAPSLLKNLPKSGGWLNSVKVVMAFIILAFGFKFLSNIDQSYHLNLLSRDLFLAVWIVLFTLLGFYLLGKIRFAHDSELTQVSVLRLALAIVTFSFAVYMVPGLFGAPLKGISGLIPPARSHSFDLASMIGNRQANPFVSEMSGSGKFCEAPRFDDLFDLPHGLKGYFDYDQGMECARRLNKPVLLDFKGHACTNCKEMEAKVWSHPEVLKRLRNDFVIIALYTDDRTRLPEPEWITSSYDGKVKDQIGKKNADFQITRFQTNTQPFYVIVDHQGNALTAPMGFQLDVNVFAGFLDRGKEAFMQ